MSASAHLAGASGEMAAAFSPIEARVVPGRACGTCTLCCKVAAVEELAKPIGAWCPHCVQKQGCSIYATRPASCRTFYCQWMLASGLGPEWKPERARFALIKSASGTHLTALVDPGFPSAWRRSPYYENLKRWAADGARQSPRMWLVDVMIGPRCIVILPDRDVDIGIVGPDEIICLERKMSATGQVIEAQKVKAALAAAAPQQLLE